MDSSSKKNVTRFQIPLLPLRDMLVFPSTVMPFFVGREKSIQALEHAMANNKEVLLTAQFKAQLKDPSPEDIFTIGTVSSILQLLRLPDGNVKVLVEGKRRAKIVDYIETEEFFLVEAEELQESIESNVENEALLRTVKISFDNYVRLNKRIPPEMLVSITEINDESVLSDTIVGHLANLKLKEKQELLSMCDPRKRLERIYSYIESEIEIIRVEKKIRARVKRQMEKTQKEYYLNEQMSAIQKELGDRDDSRAELNEIEEKIANKKLSKEAEESAKKNLNKLRMMSPMSAEATVIRNYLDVILSLPWGEFTTEIRNIKFAEKILDNDHYGLRKVKDRILEYLTVGALTETNKGPILCLVGPPGVGKTSLARSVAKSTGRKFVRISLGGVRDEADIRGHRKTYIGSMPGKIINALKKCGSSNPVVLLDEIDKISQDFRGDPTSALLEVLDPEQNSTFVDHYLDVDYDLSQVLFLATANTMDTIPGPLADRMEVISLSGYTEEEKIAISKQYLVQKQLTNNGLEKSNIQFKASAVKELVRYYTREAGVRNLEREIGSVLRKVAKKYLEIHSKDQLKEFPDYFDKNGNIAKKYIKKSKSISLDASETITDKSIKKYLGHRIFRIGLANEDHKIGLCTGLAYTRVGGDILVAEVTILPGRGKMMCTGKLGEVMQESAQAALSYVRSRADFLQLDKDFYNEIDIHIHVPEGAIPKDGPSAGIAMATALTSALIKRPVSREVAMTGEITLQGRVLPIGGLKEKAIAAHRGGIKKIIIPYDNKNDLHDFPKIIVKEIDFVPVKHMDEVLMHALVWKSQTAKSKEDKLFEKLRKITQTEVSEANLSFTH